MRLGAIKNRIGFWIFFVISITYSNLSFGILYTVDKEAVLSNDNNIQSCTAGYNVLSGVIQYSKPLISGALPYNLYYRKTTRHHLVDSEKELGADSWSDNYDGFVESYSGTYFTARGNFILIRNYTIKLPGDSNRYYFKYGPTNFTETGYPEPMIFEQNKALYRIYGSSEPPASSLPGSGWVGGGSSSTNFGELQFTTAANSMTIVRNGVEYSATVSKSSNGRVIFRFNKIKYPDGNIINLSYDSGLNLASVSDNKNNVLTFTRSGAKLSSVKYTSGSQGGYQQYNFTYNTVTAGATNYSQLTQIKNALNNRTENYTYSSALSLPYYEAAKANNVANPQTVAQRPILRSVKNHLGQTQQTWQVDYPSVVFDSSGKYILNTKTVLRSYLGENPTAFDMSTTYEDAYTTSKITMAFSPDGSQSANTIINTTHPDFTKMNVDVSGYPCLSTTDGRAIKSILYAPANQHPTQITDQNGQTTAYSFDARNRILQVVEAVGSSISRTMTYAYSTLSNGAANLFDIPNTVTAGTITVTNKINSMGQVVSKTQTSTQPGSTSKTIAYTYFADISSPSNGLLSSEDGPRSGTADKVNYSYDNYGNLASSSIAVNGAVRTIQYVEYNAFHQPERVVQPNGMVQKYNYNIDGSISSVITGSGSTSGKITGQNVTFAYDDLGRVIQTQLPDGDSKGYNYDSIGRLTRIVREDGSINTRSYFKNNIVSADEVRDGSGSTITKALYRKLDTNGRISRIQLGTDNSSNWQNFTYDLNGNPKQTVTALGIINSWTYDDLNRMHTYTDGNGDISKTGYDTNDSLISLIDANDSGTPLYTLRNGDVLAKEYNRDYGTKDYTYNEADQIVQSLYVNRKCSFPNIDEIGRNRSISCQNANGNTDAMLSYGDNYTFDLSRYGRLDKITTTTGYGVDTSYGYDVYDRIISKSQSNKALSALGTSSNTLSTSYEWSIGNKLTSFTLPSGRRLDFNYNSAQKTQISNVTLNGSILINNVTYNGGGDVIGWTWGNNAGSYAFVYNTINNGGIKQIINKNSSGGVTYSLDYGFDRDGRITNINRNNGINDVFGYDNKGNLLSESRVSGRNSIYSISYTYDKNGNRKTLRASGNHLQSASTVDYGYTGNKLTSLTKNGVAQALNYTANAELYLGSTVPTYDYAGRRRGEGQSHAISRYMSYTANNQRSLTSLSSDWVNSTVQFVYDESNNLVGEYTSSGIPIVEYIWLGSKPIAAAYGNGAATKIYYIATDALNTPRRLIDSNTSNIEWSWDSTAFGVGNPIGSVTFNLRFPGQYYDAATGQFYNHNRFYNPEFGRYMEPDPSGMAGGWNPYVYTLNNPIMYLDRDGKHPIVGIMIVGGTVGGVIGGLVDGGTQAYAIYKGESSGFNSASFFSAVGMGAAVGAVAPFAQSYLSAAALGATSSALSYSVGKIVDNKPITAYGLASSAATGATLGIFSKSPGIKNLPIQFATKAENYSKLFYEYFSDKALLASAGQAVIGGGASMAAKYGEKQYSEELNAYIREMRQIEFMLKTIQWKIIITLPAASVIKSCNYDCIKEE